MRVIGQVRVPHQHSGLVLGVHPDLRDSALLAQPLHVDLHELKGSLHELSDRMSLVRGQHIVIWCFHLRKHSISLTSIFLKKSIGFKLWIKFQQNSPKS